MYGCLEWLGGQGHFVSFEPPTGEPERLSTEFRDLVALIFRERCEHFAYVPTWAGYRDAALVTHA